MDKAYEKGIDYEIAGRRLRLLLSVYAQQEIAREYGDLANMSAKIAEMDYSKQLQATIQIVAILADAGKKFADLIGESDKVDSITAEELSILLPVNSETLIQLLDTISKVCTPKGDIEIKEDPNSKNA